MVDITKDIQSMTSFRKFIGGVHAAFEEDGAADGADWRRSYRTPRPISGCSTSRLTRASRRASGRGSMTSRTAAPDLRRRCSTKSAPRMAYRVELTARAGRNLRTLYRNIHAEDSAQA